MRKLRLAQLTSEVVGKPYGLCEKNAFDCLNLIFWYCDQQGIKLPESFEGFTRNNYDKLFERDPGQAKEVFERFIASLGQEISPAFAFAGDFLICAVKKTGERAIGIHAGGDQMMSVFLERGVALANLRAYDILTAYRPKRSD
jgi:hypothetical protein